MIGDSIIQHLEHVDYWNKVFAPMHTLNFGIGGDETQHVLWRILNGELDNVKPKVRSLDFITCIASLFSILCSAHFVLKFGVIILLPLF